MEINYGSGCVERQKVWKVLDEKKERHTGLIPTEQELQAAIDSSDPLSDESRLVIDMLKNGYARFKMDFPSYGPSTSSTKQEESKSVQQKASQKRILKAYFQGQIQRLETESTKQSVDIEGDLPKQEQVEQAIESSVAIGCVKTGVAQIEACYMKLGLTLSTTIPIIAQRSHQH